VTPVRQIVTSVGMHNCAYNIEEKTRFTTTNSSSDRLIVLDINMSNSQKGANTLSASSCIISEQTRTCANGSRSVVV